MHTKRFYGTLAIVIFYFVIYVYSDFLEECTGKPNNAFIASNTSCSHYIYCADDDSYEGECPDGDYFNEILQTCDPRYLVECKLNISAGVTASSPVVAQESTPTTLDTMGEAVITSVILTTYKPNTATEYANITSAVEITFTTSTALPNINTDTAIIILSDCPTVDNPRQMIFVPHSKSCSNYFICYHGEKLAMHCSSMLHFNVKTGKCDYPEIVRCQTDFSKPREQCQLHTVDLYPHLTNCNYFYYCRNGYLLLQQCPFGYGWDFEKRSCTVLQQALCYNTRN